jgi:hypothetical protein
MVFYLNSKNNNFIDINLIHMKYEIEKQAFIVQKCYIIYQLEKMTLYFKIEKNRSNVDRN